jgi:hypothetical protein
MRAAPVAVACGMLPVAVVVACYLLSIRLEQVPACFPFFEGCTSISAASRQDPAIHLFRAVMLPTSTLIAAYWLLVRAWLGRLGEHSRARDWITTLGLIGALFLVLYAVFLGTEGRAYNLMRRYGVTVYFSFTALAQLLLASRLHRLPVPLKLQLGRGVIGPKLACGAGMLVLGLLNIPAEHWFGAWKVENVVEWNFALIMHGFFLLTALAWWRTDYRVTVTRRGGVSD